MIKIAINRMATGKLPQGDPRWATFNDSFVNQELATVEIANAIYTGHSYAAWHKGRRKTDNFILGQHIAVDLDTGDQRSDIRHLVNHDFVRMYGGLVHTTPSHTTAEPRARVIFFLDEAIFDADRYSSATQFVMAQFDGADQATKDASRFFYGSYNCNIEILDNILPVSHLRRLYRFWLAQRPADLPQRPAQPSKVISLPQVMAQRKAQSQDQPDDFEKACEALAKVNPWDVDYNRWIGIIAAMKREFGDAAYNVTEQWAQGKPGEVRREWDRLRTEGGKQMGVGTIFYLAAGG